MVTSNFIGKCLLYQIVPKLFTFAGFSMLIIKATNVQSPCGQNPPPPVWIGLTSQLVYILSPLQSSPEAIKESNTFFLQIVCFFNIRINKVYKIKRNVMIKDNSQGGMKVIHLASFNKSILKDQWFKNQPGFKITLTLEMVVVG